MFEYLKDYSIYIKPGYTDMRKRAEGLSFIIRNEMGKDPLEKSIFLFCGKNLKRISAIVWDGNGYLELSKRLTCEMSYKWPKCKKEALSVTVNDIEEMLKGGDPWRRFPSTF